jgi:hypothetical protein
MIGDNVTDYICVMTWDPEFECIRHHWVHKSEKDPVSFIKNLHPYETIL